jgi:signal transduction histidine kinase
MQSCEQINPRKFNGAVPAAIRSGSGARHNPAALKLAEYLHEDLAQSLCAVKYHLESLPQNQLQRGALAPSIVALQDAIRQVRALAAEMQPAPDRTSALAAARDALPPRRVRTRTSANPPASPSRLRPESITIPN